jgi:filamentous hemagglutinin
LTNSGQLWSDKITTINSQNLTNRRGAVIGGLEGVKLNLTGRYTNNGDVTGPVIKE